MFGPSELARTALASGLVDENQLQAAWAAISAGRDKVADEHLAAELVARGLVSAWQAAQLQAGHTRFTLGPYRVVAALGRGGMGQVFQAQHQRLQRTVAIKVLPREKASPESVGAFLREIRAQASLDHENLVRALDAGEDGNVYYLVTEYVPGTDLRRRVRAAGRLEMTEAARIIAQVARGLEHAHRRGFVHRDVKPGNILVTPAGLAKLSDLGLARPLVAGEDDDPRFGRIVGTLGYLSPEHILDPTNPRPLWDIYSLGTTLYFAVTGQAPFPHGSLEERLQAHCRSQPADPRELNRSLDDAFVRLLGQMMAKDTHERIQSAAEVAERLEHWASLPQSHGAGLQELRGAGLWPAQKNAGETPAPRLAQKNAGETPAPRLAPRAQFLRLIWMLALPLALMAVVAVLWRLAYR